MINPTSLTPASADLLNKIEFECDLFDGGESGEVPFLLGELSKAEAGNLLDLKVKGLITTCDDKDGRYWVILTPKYFDRYRSRLNREGANRPPPSPPDRGGRT